MTVEVGRGRAMGILSNPVHRIRSLKRRQLDSADQYLTSLPTFNAKCSILHMRHNTAHGVGLPCPPPPFNLLKLSLNFGFGASTPILPSRLVGVLSTLDVDGVL